MDNKNESDRKLKIKFIINVIYLMIVISVILYYLDFIIFLIDSNFYACFSNKECKRIINEFTKKINSLN